MALLLRTEKAVPGFCQEPFFAGQLQLYVTSNRAVRANLTRISKRNFRTIVFFASIQLSFYATGITRSLNVLSPTLSSISQLCHLLINSQHKL